MLPASAIRSNGLPAQPTAQVPLKLCIVTHNVLIGDGQGRANYEIVQEVLRRGHTITLIATSIAPDLQQHSQVNWVPIAVKGIPTQWAKNLVFFQRSAHWLRSQSIEFDLIQLNGAISSARAQINAVHFVHGVWLHSAHHPVRHHRNAYGFYQWLYTAWNAYWEKRILTRTPTLVAVSASVKRELLALGLPEQAITVIQNGVDLDEFCPSANPQALPVRQPWALPEGVPLALFAGDIRSNRKNLDTVLHALAQVEGLHLAVAGAIANSPYPTLAAQLGLSDRVHFLGLRRDLPELMRASDFFVFPSRYDPFGMVVLEAMACGLPVVVAPTAGAAEVVTAESGFVLSDCEDVKELTQAMHRLATESGLRQSMGQQARQIAQKHSWQSKAQEYVDLFEKMAANEYRV